MRLGIMDHVKSGQLIRVDKAVFDWILYEAANANNAGWVALNAQIIASCIHETRKAVNNAMERLRARKYIFYGDNRGNKGVYLIFINKAEIVFYVHSDDPNRKTYVSYFTNLWDAGGQFIGEEKFFARLKVRKLRLNFGLRQGFIKGLSERLNGQSLDFKNAFSMDFAEMTQVIDKLIENPALLTYLLDFTEDLREDFGRTLKPRPYLINNSNSFKELAHELSTTKTKEDFFKLQTAWEGFNPYQWLNWHIKKQLPINLFLLIKKYLLKKTDDPVFNAWGYIQTTVANERDKFNAEESILKSEADKKELTAAWDSLVSFLQANNPEGKEKDSCKEGVN